MSCQEHQTMTSLRNFRWLRVLAAIIVAELLPVLLLVAVVVVYGLVSDQTQPDSMTPDEFAPIAGNWVGPIGGFFATMFLSWWAARVITERKLSHGIAVGVGTAMLDLSLGLLMGGGEMLALLILSNCGRILAGFVGGVIASRQRPAQPIEP
jgi:hypothetical protein